MYQEQCEIFDQLKTIWLVLETPRTISSNFPLNMSYKKAILRFRQQELSNSSENLVQICCFVIVQEM